jgi:hypothetical protein
MRKSILFCLIILNCFLFSNAQKTALSTIVSLSVENESIYTILKKIENQTNVRFMYNPHVLRIYHLFIIPIQM